MSRVNSSDIVDLIIQSFIAGIIITVLFCLMVF